MSGPLGEAPDEDEADREGDGDVRRARQGMEVPGEHGQRHRAAALGCGRAIPPPQMEADYREVAGIVADARREEGIVTEQVMELRMRLRGLEETQQ